MIDHLSFLMSNARLTPMQVPRSTSIKSNGPSGFALPAITFLSVSILGDESSSNLSVAICWLLVVQTYG